MRKGNHGHTTPRPAASEDGAPGRARLRAVPLPPGPPARPSGPVLSELEPGGDFSAGASYLAQLRGGGYRSQRVRLDRAVSYLLPNTTAGTFPWETLTYEDVLYVRTRLLSDGASASTVNMTLVALRQAARIARQHGQLSPEVEAAIRDVRNVRAERLPPGRMLTKAERRRLFRACDREGGALASRDACVLALGLGCGLRREEISSLPLSAFDPRGPALRFVGKGDREAELPLPTRYARAVHSWLRLRGDAPGPLLAPVTRDGRVLAGRAVSDQAVYRAVRRSARRAGVEPCTPHDLRRTFISELLDVADGETAQGLARHASFSTTARYSRRGERTRRRAVERLYAPFERTPARPRPRRKPHRRRRRRKRPNTGLAKRYVATSDPEVKDGDGNQDRGDA